MPRFSPLALLACALLVVPVAHAQGAPSPRTLHEAAAYATVRVTGAEGVGSGWLLEQAGGRPVVITTRHLFCPVRPGVTTCRGGLAARIDYYRGASSAPITARGEVRWFSPSIDLALVVLGEDPPTSARPLAFGRVDLVRGDRVVVAGEPQAIGFLTGEGIVAGSLGSAPGAAWCGAPGTCVVVDAASFAGASGGVVLTADGRLAGMLWSSREAHTAPGRPEPWSSTPRLAFVMHAQTIERELRDYGESRRARP